jgi:hypothetical protein
LASGCGSTGRQPPYYHGLGLAEPYLHVKERFLITEKDSQFVPAINSASESIARFVIDLYALPPGESQPRHIRQVDPAALESLRLPPLMPGDHRRFIFSSFYCWSMPDSEHLEFLLEWGHVSNRDRYTDSYVFRRAGSGWMFERHGQTAPKFSKEPMQWYVRQCPA